MDTSGKDLAPLAVPEALRFWWLEQIHKFDRIEIRPSKIMGTTPHGREIAGPCVAEEASFWTVYGHYRLGTECGPLGGVDAFKDFPTEAKAKKFREILLICFPHLAGHPPRPTAGIA
jgi:hypothetical protein